MADKEMIETTDAEETQVAVTEEKKASKGVKSPEKKPGFFKRMIERIKKFWKNYKSELKKITWFSRKQTFTSTLLVLVCMIISAAFIGAIDFGFSKGIEGLGLLVELFRG